MKKQSGVTLIELMIVIVIIGILVVVGFKDNNESSTKKEKVTKTEEIKCVEKNEFLDFSNTDITCPIIQENNPYKQK